MRRFIDDAADVDLDADEDDEDFIEESGVKDLEREMAERQSAARVGNSCPMLECVLIVLQERERRSAVIADPEAEAAEMRRLAQEVSRRYGRTEDEDDDMDEEEEEDEDVEHPSQSTTQRQRRRGKQARPVNPLPTIHDPKLWLVRCKPGLEQQIICDIMNRCYARMSLQQDPVFIKTAFITNVGSGYLYVEAEKEIHVRKALANIRVNTQKIKLVPIKEMVQAITVQKKRISLKRGDWVRLKRGVYKGDLAQVVATGDQGTQVTVKVIPRIDYSKLSGDDKQGICSFYAFHMFVFRSSSCCNSPVLCEIASTCTSGQPCRVA